MDETTLKQMIESAAKAMANAHVPVSSFPVGAAVLTKDGNIYNGCNTESIIAGLGTCAERSAIDHAVVHGEKCFTDILVVSLKKGPLFPCGVCRQYIYEFAQVAGLDTMVHALKPDGGLESAPISTLTPRGFGPMDKDG